jgi:hypothetical protein
MKKKKQIEHFYWGFNAAELFEQLCKSMTSKVLIHTCDDE